MAILHPFRALRPHPDFAARVASVPYDVINTEEARQLSDGNPHSFLHVIRPEIDLPEGTDEHADAVYTRGAENLQAYAAGDAAIQENEPAVYVYRLIMNGRSQTGVYGCVSVADYDDDTILKHEKTRPDKEADRTRHIITQRAHAEPVMLTFRDSPAVAAGIAAAQATPPLYDFTAPDGVRHTIWKVPNADAMVEAFAHIPHLYVADGHHRCKAASLAAAAVEEAGDGTTGEHFYFPAVLFPMGEMAILPYNRIVYRLGMTPPAFLEKLSAAMPLRPAQTPTPRHAGDVCIYLAGSWHEVTLPATRRDTVTDTLDVARLSEHILEPILGIGDPRTDPNIYFVGGIRGTAELERLVDTGKAAVAFSMYPTSVAELLAVSDAGLLMPPKSTWFEPKLRSGLLVHLF
ncbi:MAG: DUF1015 family protein [Rhodothermales bacterium]